MILAAIVAAAVIIVVPFLIVTLAGRWLERRDECDQKMADAAKAWGIVGEQRDTIADLEHKLVSADALLERMTERGDRLLGQVYELRQSLTRVHTGCFDLWHDGGEPCVNCRALLEVSRG